MLGYFRTLIKVKSHPKTVGDTTVFTIKHPTRKEKKVQSLVGESLRLLQHSLYPKYQSAGKNDHHNVHLGGNIWAFGCQNQFDADRTNIMLSQMFVLRIRLKKTQYDYNYLKCFSPTMSAKLNLG